MTTYIVTFEVSDASKKMLLKRNSKHTVLFALFMIIVGLSSLIKPQLKFWIFWGKLCPNQIEYSLFDLESILHGEMLTVLKTVNG